MRWNLLAPGPSATQELADWLLGRAPAGVVCNAYELAPWADFLASSDSAWWRNYPDAVNFAGRKYTMHIGVPGVARVQLPTVNSGVLALVLARRSGATEIHLHGFDFGLGHFFGDYKTHKKNIKTGLKNTTADKRQTHQTQFRQWAHKYPNVRVVNCTPGSLLKGFEYGSDENIFRAQGFAERTGVERIHSATARAECATVS